MSDGSPNIRPNATTATAFTFEDVTVRRGDREALSNVTATVPDGGITAVAGPSGAGKTTLLRLCNRLEVPTSGRVTYRGHDIATLDPLRLRREVGMVFQRPVLLPGTVRDNLLIAAPHAEREALAEALRRVALDPALLERPGTALSGGEAQRACLARTLVTQPAVLLLDEPTSALDAAPRRVFEDLCLQLARDGMPVLWVTHDLDQLQRVADTVIVLAAGRLRYAGEPSGAFSEPGTIGLLSDGAPDGPG